MEWFNLPKGISKKEAEKILDYMRQIIDHYGYVTLADFYDLLGSKVSVYTDNKKEWYTLNGARVASRRKDGRYRILLPIPEEVL